MHSGWRRLSGEVTLVGRPRDADLLPDYLFLVTVLTQFKLPQVQRDFLGGAFRLPERSQSVSLEELHLLSDRLLPPLFGHDASSIRADVFHGKEVLDMIVSKCAGTVQLSRDRSVPLRTFKKWYQILGDLADCPYWREASRVDGLASQSSISVQTNSSLVHTVVVGVGTPSVSCVDMGTDPLLGLSYQVSDRATPCSPDGGGDKPVMKTDANNNVMPPLSDQSVVGLVGQALPKMYANRKLSQLESVNTVGNESANACQSNVRPCCSWCHKENHTDENCWRKRGLCLICGGHHSMIECHKYIPPGPQERPTCSTCGGAHLGRNCQRLMRLGICCHWCGRRGHTEDNCRVKSGACLICGSSDHILLQCPCFVPKTVLPMFPPWCSKCGSHHIGNECELPYIE